MMTVRRLALARAAGIACLLALATAAGSALAAETEHMDRPAPTKEMREKMASAHEQMAACLRSDRPTSDCHAEMMQHHDMMMHHGTGGHEGMHKDDCDHKAQHDHAMAEHGPADADPK